MSRAWLLPEHVSDVLPLQAVQVETLRRRILDVAAGHGFELVMPPLVEHLESLLTGTGSELDLQTFKLVDQLSGRTLGIRADTTPQAARIDAHLLNREGITRLCYCGPVLHAIPDGALSDRELLQFGAEVFGCAGLEADLEVMELAVACLEASGFRDLTLDLADARVLKAVLAPAHPSAEQTLAVAEALRRKDLGELRQVCGDWPEAVLRDLSVLLSLYGDVGQIDAARQRLTPSSQLHEALQGLEWLATQLVTRCPSVELSVDLADLGGYHYYSGPRFTLLSARAQGVVARGGRYDEVGAVFGRNRPAVGFGMDVKTLASQALAELPRRAVRAPWSSDPALKAAIQQLRAQGQVVITALASTRPDDGGMYQLDRELVQKAGQWVLQALD